MTYTRKRPSSNGRKAPPLAIIVAFVVLAVLLFVIYKLTLGKSNPEQADALVIAAANTVNAPTSAEAQPKPEKREPQPGDTILLNYWTVPPAKPGGLAQVVVAFELVLVSSDKHGQWTAHERIAHWWDCTAEVIGGNIAISEYSSSHSVMREYLVKVHTSNVANGRDELPFPYNSTKLVTLAEPGKYNGIVISKVECLDIAPASRDDPTLAPMLK